MATKKQVQELEMKLATAIQAAQSIRDHYIKKEEKARRDMLKTHNAINTILSNMDECEGDFWFSDLQRLRKTRDNIRKWASIVPPKDDEGRSLHYCHEWVLEDR